MIAGKSESKLTVRTDGDVHHCCLEAQEKGSRCYTNRNKDNKALFFGISLTLYSRFILVTEKRHLRERETIKGDRKYQRWVAESVIVGLYRPETWNQPSIRLLREFVPHAGD